MSKKTIDELDRMIEIQNESEKISAALDSLISQLKTRPVGAGRAREIFRKYDRDMSEKIHLSKMLSDMREE
ncbi:hypothetical protein KAX17_04020 [Candidatus Bipolaricaulota bacterium]|nr:hypothetical protein [Candidatus Bipolaricaulota bacterium]